MSRSRIFAFILVALTIATTSISGMNTPPKEKRIAWANEPEVLAGIKTVNLHLAIRGDVKNAKTGEAILRKRIEQRLRKAGLKILTNDKATMEEVPVMLTVIIESRGVIEETPTGASKNGGGVYLVTVHLDDIVVPHRNPEIVILGATTWNRRRFGYAGKDELPSKSLNDALALIDEFCAAKTLN